MMLMFKMNEKSGERGYERSLSKTTNAAETVKAIAEKRDLNGILPEKKKLGGE